MKYYVYHLIDPRDNQPFYVGKGYKRRMYQHEGEARSNYWNNKAKCKKIQDIWAAGLEVQYLQEFCESDEQSRIREKELILLHGRVCDGSGILTNVHVGGNGGGKIGKPVCQYTKAGELIAEFVSASEAERQTGVRLGEVTAVCRGEWKCAGGFQWRLKGELPIVNYVRENLRHRTKVFQYTMNGEFVAEYDTQYSASLAVSSSIQGSTKISACCARILPSYKGYQWRLTQRDTIDNIVPQLKPVAQYDMNDTLITSFVSIMEATRTTGINNIGKCCNGTYKQAGGYKWKFISS